MLETLCFDMVVEQPWVILQRSIRGLDELLQPKEGNAESSRSAKERVEANGTVHGNGKGKIRLSERIVLELGWVFVNEA